jgi:hypothetical protein
MANTVTQTTLVGSGSDKVISRRIHIVSDGTEESDLVIYDNSTLINDASKGRVRKIEAYGSSCQLLFEWDQTTDAPIAALDPANSPCLDFIKTGGGENPNGTGATGDVLLTTTNLDSGDVVTIFIEVAQT